MSVGLHCRLARPGRMAALAEFLDFALTYSKSIWFCTREQVADFWSENHYPVGAGSPMRSDQPLITVSHLGGIGGGQVGGGQVGGGNLHGVQEEGQFI
jgi:hypothetical protein